MGIVIKEVSTRRDLRKFIHLPFKINEGNQNWLPPVLIDEWSFFNSKRNKSFSQCKTILYLAFKEGKSVGRIMGIIHEDYNAQHHEMTARFAFIDSINDQQVVHQLIMKIADWARGEGMKKLVGPFGFSDKDPQGLMVDGFEHPPIIVSPTNMKYLVNLVEKEGFEKEIDCLVYIFNLSQEAPPIYHKATTRLMQKGQFELLEFKSKKEIKPVIIPALRLMNSAYHDIYGFIPLDESEMIELAKRYMPVLDADFIKIIRHNGKIVSFVVGIPNMNEGLKKANGRLFPTGLFHILRSKKNSRKLDLMLGGIHPQYQGRGLDAMMILPLLESAKKRGFKKIEVHLMLESNKKVLAEMHKAGASYHKRYRIFRKSI